MTDASRDVTTRLVPTRLGRLQVCEHAGDEPVLVLMYGFPRRLTDLQPARPPAVCPAGSGLRLPRLRRLRPPQAGAVGPAGHLLQLGAVRDELGIGTAVVHLVDGASRWPQWDRPKAVAELIR